MIWSWLEIEINNIVIMTLGTNPSHRRIVQPQWSPSQAKFAKLISAYSSLNGGSRANRSVHIGHYYWISVILSGLRFGVVRLDDDDAYIGLAWKIRFPGIARYWTGDSILWGKESSTRPMGRPMGILRNNFKLGLAVHPMKRLSWISKYSIFPVPPTLQRQI